MINTAFVWLGWQHENRRYAVFLTEHRLFLVFIRKDILTSRFQWVMAWEAAFHREVLHSPPQPDQSGSPEKARHCRWGQNLLAEWKRQCHLFLFLTLIVRIQYEKVTPIITFFQKKERACFPWCGKQAQLEISCHAKECNRMSE